MTNREAFVTALALLGATYDKKLTDAAVQGYWIALGDLTESEFAAATKRALSTLKFMPSPSELLTFAGKARNVTAEAAIAWEAVRKAIRMHDYTVATIDFGALVNTALRCMGPWEWLCEQSDDDMVWRQKDFERFYVAFAEGHESALRSEPLNGWGLGRVGCENVRVSIDGKPLPVALPPAPSPLAAVVRELADSKTQAGAAPCDAGFIPTVSALPLRETKPKAPPMSAADVEARKAEIAARFAARGTTLPEAAT